MNKLLIAPIAAIVAVALKQYLNLEFTNSEVEEALTFSVTVSSALWAAFMSPKKGA